MTLMGISYGIVALVWKVCWDYIFCLVSIVYSFNRIVCKSKVSTKKCCQFSEFSLFLPIEISMYLSLHSTVYNPRTIRPFDRNFW